MTALADHPWPDIVKPIQTLGLYALAALAEIAGCFAFRAWRRQRASMLWLGPGLASLVLLAWLLTLTEPVAAGRAYAAYGGIHVAAAPGWLWAVEGVRPDHRDVAGTLPCLAGTVTILAGPRAA